MKKVIFISGPFRGRPELNQWNQFRNIWHAEALALEVWRAGAAAICPHANTAHFQGALPNEVWLDGDLEIMLRCDAVIMVSGWQFSSGAETERRLAKMKGIPVFENIDDLKDWLKKQ